MKVIVDAVAHKILGHENLGQYSKPVRATFNAPMRPGLPGVHINSAETFNLCHNKPRIFGLLQGIGAPIPKFCPCQNVISDDGLDVSAYEEHFEAGAVLRTPDSTKLIRNYADLLTVFRQDHDWKSSVFYEQIDDYFYRVTFVATRLTQVLHKSEKRDHVVEVIHGQGHMTPYYAEMTEVATEIVQHVQADFVRVEFIFGPGGFQVVDVSTGITRETVQAAKSIITRKVAMASGF